MKYKCSTLRLWAMKEHPRRLLYTFFRFWERGRAITWETALHVWLYISKQWFNFKSNNQDVQNPGWLHNKSAYALCAQALKGIVMPKINICWKCTHPQAIRNVEEFGSSWEQIWRNVVLHHLLINRTSAVNGCRQKESKLIKHHNNPHQSSASVLRSEKLHVCKKQIHHLGI